MGQDFPVCKSDDFEVLSLARVSSGKTRYIICSHVSKSIHKSTNDVKRTIYVSTETMKMSSHSTSIYFSVLPTSIQLIMFTEVTYLDTHN